VARFGAASEKRVLRFAKDDNQKSKGNGEEEKLDCR
jgi:hypothetical protein